MTRMIPPVVGGRRTSRGEREVFRRLSLAAGVEDWTALHSLDLADHIERLSGEVDFVIVVPKMGVLCVEVKGCGRVARRGGLWFYGKDPKGDPRGPFKQAEQAMHSLRRHLAERRPQLRSVPFFSCVIFPFTLFREVSPEWHPWQVIDQPAFANRPLDELLLHVLQRSREHVRSQPSGAWLQQSEGQPTVEQCRRIVQACRRDIEVFESPISRRQRLESELRTFTEEQFVALDAMEENPRVAFHGPAGTGKTLLAIEAARRSAAQGRRTMLI